VLPAAAVLTILSSADCPSGSRALRHKLGGRANGYCFNWVGFGASDITSEGRNLWKSAGRMTLKYTGRADGLV